MVSTATILVRRIALAGSAAAFAAGVTGCGQKGPLFLPTEPAAAGRATLPETLVPGTRAPAAASVEPPAGK
jgi:predicted small lipoprotein YifL